MLGKRLRDLRLKKGLKQLDLADMLGVSRTTYTQYETGRSEPDLATIIKLAQFFGVSVDYLLGLTDIRNYDDVLAKLACYESEEWTEEEQKEIDRFKEFIKMKREQEDDLSSQ